MLEQGLKDQVRSLFEGLQSEYIFRAEVDAHCRTDVSVVPFKQIVVAIGEGSKAALSAFEDQLKDKLRQVS
jgi:NADH-dependent peroxiredoxin subunit F